MRIQTGNLQAARAVAPPDAVAGILCGLVAGVAYLAAQMSFSALSSSGDAWEPLQRIAAILLGEDAAPPSADVTFTIVGMALLIHFALAIVFGRIVDWVARGSTLLRGAVRGAAVGAVIYAVDFWLLAPLAFPWFAQTRGLATGADHLLFGVVAAVSCLLIRMRRAGA